MSAVPGARDAQFKNTTAPNLSKPVTVTPIRPRRTARRSTGPVVVPAPPVPAKRRSRPATSTEVEQHLATAAALQAQIQRLESELRPHRDWLLAHFTTTGERTATLGTFSAHLRSRANWSYSPRLENEMLRIRQEQKREQLEGIADNNPTPYVALVHKPAKD